MADKKKLNPNQNQSNPDQQDEQQTGNQVRNHPIGPLSTEGVEARDLPDGGRGGVETDQHHQHARKLPQKTGENDTGDVGMRAFPSSADMQDHGYRKRN